MFTQLKPLVATVKHHVLLQGYQSVQKPQGRAFFQAAPAKLQASAFGLGFFAAQGEN